MTEQLSREIVENLLQHNDESDSPANAEAWEVNALCRMLLAGMDSEPVAWTDEQELKDLEKSGCAYIFTVNPITPNADPRRVIRLYTTPPAPVAVPDFDKWSRGCKISLLLCYSEFREVAELTWNDACASMLNAGPVTAATVQDGWKLVPVEPTEEMLASAKEWFGLTATAKGVYEKMIAAAPAAPEQEV